MPSSWQQQVALSKHTTLKVGGPAEFFVSVTSEDELLKAVTAAQEAGVVFRVLGGGSNVLVPDEGLRGLTIKNCIGGYQIAEHADTVLLTVGAGEVFDTVVGKTVAAGYWGLENLSHIPGSVGATPVQNVGAYGVEIKDVVESVRALDTVSLTFQTFSTDECTFSYRDSFFKQPEGSKYIITSVTLKLAKVPRPQLAYKDMANYFSEETAPTVQDVRDAVITIRAKKFPDWKVVGTAGSFFKNPIIDSGMYATLKEQHPDVPAYLLDNDKYKIALGWILDHVCELRGVHEGHVGTYEGQALVLVNDGNASANEIDHFAKKIAEKVFRLTGITIKREVNTLK